MSAHGTTRTLSVLPRVSGPLPTADLRHSTSAIASNQVWSSAQRGSDANIAGGEPLTRDGHVAEPHSITWSARNKIDAGIVMPSALAVLRFRDSSYFVGCRT